MHHIIRSLFLAFAATVLIGAQTAPPPADEGVVFVGAGDIANCEMLGGARATAALLDSIEGTVFTTGDHAYQTGSAKDFAKKYSAAQVGS